MGRRISRRSARGSWSPTSTRAPAFPDEPLPAGWDDIPGARGCTPQSCAYRDALAEFDGLGATVVGISAQTPAEQAEFAEREHIPFALLSDSGLLLAAALELPTFEVEGMTLYRRLTLVAEKGRIATSSTRSSRPIATRPRSWAGCGRVSRDGVGTTLHTPLGRRVKVIEEGEGTPMVFLHSGVGSAGEWKQVFSLWPEGHRLIAIEAYRDGSGPGPVEGRSLDDYADQVYAVAAHVGGPVHLVGFSWGGATSLRVAVRRPSSSTRSPSSSPRHTGCCGPRTPTPSPDLRPARSAGARCARRALARGLRGVRRLLQRARLVRRLAGAAPRGVSRRPAGAGETSGTFSSTTCSRSTRSAGVTAPVHVVEGSQTSTVDHAICDVVRRHVPDARHTLIEGAGHMMPLTHPEPLARALLTGIET